MDNLIKEQIKFKISDIDKLFLEYDLIFKKIEAKTPDLFDMTILGSVLHSFYNGLENIFEIIAKNIDNNDNIHIVWKEIKQNLENFICS